MENTGRLKFSYVRKILEESCSPQEMKRVLEKLDSTKEARISFEEFLPYVHISMTEQDEDMIKSAFQKLDVNGDK